MRAVILTLGVLATLGLGAGSAAFAAGGGHGPKLEPAGVDLSDTASLQRGARYFVNYCLSCHSAGYMRYNRMAKDLGISEELVETNLMFTTDKIGDTMKVAMPPDLAESWFGVVPPDLTVIARSRGADWLFNFLQGFYLDESRPTGVNNIVFPDTAMPHVLWELQGFQKAVMHDDEHGKARVDHLELAVPGEMEPGQYTRAVRDLTAYLVYMGEPAKLVRYKIGAMVIGFLLLLLIPVYLMKREYWKDVH